MVRTEQRILRLFIRMAMVDLHTDDEYRYVSWG